MEMIIERNLKMNKYVYRNIKDITCNAFVNYTFGIWLRKISIIKGDSIYVMRQTNLFLRMVIWFTFLVFPTRVLPKFKFYDNGILKGETKGFLFSPRVALCIKNNNYEVCIQKNNYISIMKNDVQIGFAKKENKTIAEKNRYQVTYDELLENDKMLIFLLVVFSDIIYYPNHFRLTLIKYEKTIT